MGSATTYYVYDGGTLLAELDGSGNVTRLYTWGPLGLVSDTGTVNGAAQTRLYGYDALGSTRLLVNGGTGTVSWQGAWSAWGAAQDTGSGACPSTFGYKGQTGAYTDTETSLLLMGARYYAPGIGRFLSRDPSGFAAGANLYGFCGGDPVNFFDPNGCEGISYNDLVNKLWDGVGAADRLNQHLGPLGCPPLHSLAEAHDAVEHAGESAGNTKKSPHDTQVDAAYAALHCADAVMQCAGLALPVVGALGEAEAAVGACEGGSCFVAGTLVWTAYKDSAGQWHTGTKRIEEVTQGEYVIARDPQSGKTEYKRVTKTFVRHTAVTVSVTLADAKSGQAQEVITASREHPFYVDGKGFVPAGGLAVGNSIVTRAGPALVVQNITWNRRVEGYTVYNFEVEDDHSYFVGATFGGAWVHNTGDCLRPKISTSLPDRVTKALPAGETRTAAENAQARNFFERNRAEAQKWWESRTGETWPSNASHAEHPTPLKDGGDPLHIEPGYDGPASPHRNGDFSRWGAMGGRPANGSRVIGPVQTALDL